MSLSTAAITVNVILGLAYSTYWVMVLVDLKRGRVAKGRETEYAYAWLAMAVTCGGSHLIHAAHLWEYHQGALVDVVATGFSIPFGILWFLLQVEGMFLGGEGDRRYSNGLITTMLLVAWGIAFFGSGLYIGATIDQFQWAPPVLWFNGIVFCLYSAVAVVMWRSQVQAHRATGQWSFSGVDLGTVLWTCAFLHLVCMGWLVAIGTYVNDLHMAIITALAIPPAWFYLRVWRKMYAAQVGTTQEV